MNKETQKQIVRLLSQLFILIVAYIPFHGLVSTWTYSNFGYELFFKSWKEILLALMLLAAAVVALSNKEILKILWGRLINKLIAGYVVLHLVMALYTEQTLEALLHSLAINLRFLAFFLIAQVLVESVRAKELRARVKKTLLVVATVVSTIVLIQMFLPKEFLEWFGYSKETIPPYFTIDRNLDFIRYAATTRGPNVLGAYLILPITMVTALFFKKYNWKKVLQVAVMFGAMFLTFSRSAWLGLIASVGTFKLFFAPEKVQKITRRALPALLVLVVIFVAVFATTDVIQNTVFHQDPGEGGLVDSTREHLNATKEGVKDVLENPLGSGPGTAGPASFRNDEPPKVSENYFVQVGQEVGILGLALFVWINVLLGKMLLDKRNEDLMKLVLFATLIGLTMVSMFLHGWADEEVALTFWGVAGLYVSSSNKGVSKKVSRWLLLGVIAAIMVVTVSLFVQEKSPEPNTVTISPTEEIQTARFIVLGDSGSGSDEQLQIAKLIDQEKFDGVLHTGDVAYNKGKESELIKNFENVYSLRIRQNFWPSPGNHDYATDSLAPYLKYFELPENALNPGETERYYSVDIKGVHLIALDTNEPLTRISDEVEDDMADWLTDDLSNHSSSDKIIVFFHHPPFNTGGHEPDLEVRTKLVPIFEEYGVDLVLSGHDHSYQRTCKLVMLGGEPTCSEEGIPYVISGGGGKALYEIQAQQPEYFEFAKSTFNYVRLTVNKNILLEAVDLDGEVIDSVVYLDK